MKEILKNWKRWVVHIPHGLANGWVLTSWPGTAVERSVAAVLYFVCFLAYEHNEDKHLHDEAWKDIAGWMPGFLLWLVFYKLVV
jgi:hypothetical protein